MLITEKAELIERVVSLQTELMTPVETKSARLMRAIVTSMVIGAAFNFIRPLGKHLPPFLNVILEIAVSVGVVYLASELWRRARKPAGLNMDFEPALLSAMSLEELQKFELDLKRQVRERGDRAFFSDESEENVISFALLAVTLASGLFFYSVAMSFQGFGSLMSTLMFIGIGSLTVAGLAAKFCVEPLRNAMRFLVRSREYIWYVILALAYIAARLTSK